MQQKGQLVFMALVLAFVITWLFSIEPVASQNLTSASPPPSPTVNTGSRVGDLWQKAQNAFGAGDFAGSALNLEELIKCTAVPLKRSDNTPVQPAKPNQAWMEPVFFMLGASYFNAKDWPKAISSMERYEELFPRGERLTQVVFSLGQADYYGERYSEATSIFKKLLLYPFYHKKAVMFLIKAYDKTEDIDNSISLLENETSQPNVDLFYLEKLNLKLGTLYQQKAELGKAVNILHQIDKHISYVEDVTEFNSLAVILGDAFIKTSQVDSAMDCYRRVRDNEQILELQQAQVVILQKRRAFNMAQILGHPITTFELQLDNQDIDKQIARDQEILVQYKALPPILPPIFLRVAHAYSLDGRLWEAAVVFGEIVRRYPDSKEAEMAQYASIVCFDHLKRTERARALCEGYLKKYPAGKYVGQVGFLRGILAYDAEDFDKAKTYLMQALPTETDPAQKQQTELILGDICLREQKYPEAIASYQKFIKDYPGTADEEKAVYRTQLALSFSGKLDDAETGFQSYIAKYPAGFYVPDAEYRLAVISFARKQYDKTIQECLTWQQKHGKDGPLGEVLSLLGDCYALEDKTEDAVATYTKAYKAAKTTEVLSYAIFAAAKLLQKQGKWPEILSMFQDFIKDNPDSPLVVSAVSWVGRAEIKLGQIEQARQYLADTIKKYINDPSRDSLDEIITQLAMLYAHKHGSASQTASGTVTNPTSEEDELAGIMSLPDTDKKPTAQARILFAKAELARIHRKSDTQHDYLLQIATKFKPEQLSPTLLGEAGDCLLADKKPEAADPFYQYIIDQYADSPLIDFAYNGLGQIAYDNKDYEKALFYYNKALDEGLATTRLKDITLGKAKSLLALGRLDEAKPVFEEVASTREWRGECTAYSVLCLGDIQMTKQHYPEANAYYQRVYLAYQKYPEIEAEAYLKSGEAFEKMSKVQEAKNTYLEMLRNTALAQYPQFADARNQLEHLTQ